MLMMFSRGKGLKSPNVADFHYVKFRHIWRGMGVLKSSKVWGSILSCPELLSSGQCPEIYLVDCCPEIYLVDCCPEI